MSPAAAGKTKGGKRSAARLAAVQALYQIELAGASAQRVIEEFVAQRLGREIEGDRYNDADADWFADVVRGVDLRRAEIDERLGRCLDKERTLDRLEAILRAILRAAAYELLARVDVPAKVVISEYLDVAHAFFAGAVASFANGVLDRLARELRGGEFQGPDLGRARSR